MDEVAAAAAHDASTIAERAGVEVRTLVEFDELAAAERVYESIWGGPDAAMKVELMRVLSETDNYVGGAFVGDELVAMAVGFRSAYRNGSLHSHVAAVVSAQVGRGIGFALKLHQRAWALARDMPVITWTFDPLIRRNAYLNLTKLGAEVAQYHRNFYGPQSDGVNDGDETDRILVAWPLAAERVRRIAGGVRPAPPDGAGLPALIGAPPRYVPLPGERVTIAVPEDVEALRRADPAAAAPWRYAVRAALEAELAAGSRIAGFDPATGYFVERRVA